MKIFMLGDFGFAKRTKDIRGTVLGTAQFMSPEVYTCETYGEEVDMWAIGVMLFFMLNAEYPFSNIRLTKILTRMFTKLRKEKY